MLEDRSEQFGPLLINDQTSIMEIVSRGVFPPINMSFFLEAATLSQIDAVSLCLQCRFE
jgi:hypothetical protein